MDKSAYKEFQFLRQNHYLPHPQIMQVEITTICPLNCPQCYKEETLPRTMNIEKFIEIINDAKKSGVKAITLLGGEPLIHPDICEMIQILDNAEIVGGTYTSGIGINKKIIDVLQDIKTPFYFFLSLNGSAKEIHELSRSSFEITKKAMQYLKENNVEYSINWVARHDNISDLKNVIGLVKEYQAKYLNVVCNKIDSHGNITSPLTKEDYNDLKKYFEVPENRNVLKLQNCYGILKNILGISNESILSGCQAGISVCSVDAEGKYRPCLHLNYIEEYDTIMQYWENSPVLVKLRENYGKQYEICDPCKFRGTCRFCRAMSIETHNDFEVGLLNCPVKEDG